MTGAIFWLVSGIVWAIKREAQAPTCKGRTPEQAQIVQTQQKQTHTIAHKALKPQHQYYYMQLYNDNRGRLKLSLVPDIPQ